MARQAALPGHEYLPEALPRAEVIVWLIEAAVPEACAHYGGYQKRIEKRIQEFFLDAFAAEEPAENVPSENESRDEQQAVPTHLQGAQVEHHRVYVPMYCKLYHLCSICPQ